MRHPIKTALLSYGMSGHVFHAPFIHLHDGFELMGSWERSKKKIQEFYPNVTSYKSLEAILENPDIELVIVNTPTSTHFEFAKKALEAGKHVVVEKAFTSTAAEAETLNELAKEKKLVLSVFQNRRWDSDFLTVKSILDNQQLGKVIEANFGFLRYNPNLSPKAHKETPNSGSGIVKDLGPHIIDQALSLFGVPKAVMAEIAITRENSQVDDYFNIILLYQNLRVILKAGYFFKETWPSYVIHGTKGSFLKSRGDVQEDQLKNLMKPNDPAYGIEPQSEEGHLNVQGDFPESIPTLRGNYMNYYNNIFDAIANQAEVAVSAQDGINVMKVIDAAFESSKTGQRIEL